ncbi:protein angel homolog 1 [Chanos chanos]|uniref:Protein angel homolog 1 n=1 Tax=Chanos chanos TaxID=29144 RepID=A0A6J2UNJ8_CHACN|nr:protein angel homolog 1-like [Chanos chanos]
MIGSLMFYALYPLSRFINSFSGFVWSSPSSVFINGKEEWDGVGAPSRRWIAGKEDWSNKDIILKEGTVHGRREWRSYSVTDSELESVEGNTDVTQEKEKGASEWRDTPKEEEKEEMSPQKKKPSWAREKEAEGVLAKENATTVKMTEGPSDNRRNIGFPEERRITSLQEREKQREHDEMVTKITMSQPNERTVSVKELEKQTSSDHCDTHLNLDNCTVSEASYAAGIYQDPQTGAGDSEDQPQINSPLFDLSALLADRHTETWDSYVQYQPVHTPGWHFPVGPGLTEMVHCPPWEFLNMSYYPPLQESEPFEVMWRVWEDLTETRSDLTSPKDVSHPKPHFEFSVMSYNILAQDLLEANQELYTHCTEEVLVWDNRLNVILQEFQTWKPDIICLQEVQENHFIQQLQPALHDLGYACIYKRRTGDKTDGCAVCFRRDRFSQLSVRLLEFRRHQCELLDRDNVGIVLLLQPVSTTEEETEFSPICVANTHLLFNPRRGDVKLAQLAIVMAEIDSVVKECKIKGRSPEVILCGDLNSLPNTPLYQFITSGQLCYHGLPAWMISGQEDLSYKTHYRRLYAPLWPDTLGINDNCQYTSDHKAETTKPSGKLQYNHDFLLQLRYCPAACVRPADLEFITGVTDNTPDLKDKEWCNKRFRYTICHGLKLKSVYSHVMSGTGQYEVTTLHSEGGATVDYIFYSLKKGENKGGLRLLGRLGLLSEADLWSVKGLPNEIFPSDHLSLLAKFQLDASR